VLQVQPECIELLVPESFVPGHPLRRGLHGQGVEFAANHTPFLGTGDQSGSLKHREVLHEARQGHEVRLGEIADRGTTCPELLDHMAPRGIGQGREYQVEVGRLMLNHLVKHIRSVGTCQVRARGSRSRWLPSDSHW
jgi:hypothetical protein